jgi:hypothetical protein
MSAIKILEEAQTLNGVSDRLDSLAEQHPKASDALLVISHGIRDSAVLLKVLVTTKMSSATELQ